MSSADVKAPVEVGNFTKSSKPKNGSVVLLVKSKEKGVMVSPSGAGKSKAYFKSDPITVANSLRNMSKLN